MLFIIILVLTGTYLYGRYIETKNFKVKEYSIIDPNLPNSFQGIKIVQISDIHYKTIINKEELNSIVNKVNLIKPDIVILTGDIFDKSIKYSDDDFNDIKEILKNIEYSLGKYTIKGDNDLSIEKYDDIITYSDFIDLNDRYELIYNEGLDPILVVGISSNYNNNHIKDTLDNIYSKIKKEYKYSILAIHEPDFISYIDYSKFNLILAGHSLNGQIKLPYIGGILKNKYSKVYYDEFYNLGNTKLYISSGIGTNKYKFRLFNRPSISLYRLRNK